MEQFLYSPPQIISSRISEVLAQVSSIYNGLLAAIQKNSNDKDGLIPLIQETFARTVLNARRDKRFSKLHKDLVSVKVYGTSYGLACPKFEEFLTVAQKTGALDRPEPTTLQTDSLGAAQKTRAPDKPDPTHYRGKVTMAPEKVKQVQEELGDKWPEIENLAKLYLRKARYSSKNS